MKTKNGLTISLSNQKLGGFIPSLNLPAVITCRCDAPCKKDCYACKGNFKYKNVMQSHLDNLKAFNTDKTAFFNDIIDFLNNGLIAYKFFRWHSSGDIVNADYFNGVLNVAQACKHTQFLIFTKKFEIVNDYLKNGGKIPRNLVVVFSAWDKTFKFENPHNLPVAYVDFKDGDKAPAIPATAFRCSGDCRNCLTCWNIKKGQSTVFKQH